MELVLVVVGISAVVVLILNSFVIVPAFHYGVGEILGRRWRTVREGLTLKFPFVEEIFPISLELGEIKVEVKFATLDRLVLVVRGSLQYKPDPDVNELDEYGGEIGRNVYISMSEAIIISGIEQAIKSVLGMVGGVRRAKDFINRREAVGLLINCLLRLRIPPHIRTGVVPTDWLRYYTDHRADVIEILRQEEFAHHDRSESETRYGIDIKTFVLADVVFDDKTIEAFEREQQAAARLRAFGTKIDMARRVIALGAGATAQEALNAADVSLDPAVKKEVVSVEGQAGVLGALLARLGR